MDSLRHRVTELTMLLSAVAASHFLVTEVAAKPAVGCQSAPNIDPLPACKIDPSFSCSSAACRGGVEPLGGTPERQAAVRRHERFLKRQLSLPVSMISQ